MDECKKHSGMENQLRTNTKNIATIFESLDKLKNRPPVWMSLLFSVALFVIGFLAKK